MRHIGKRRLRQLSEFHRWRSAAVAAELGVSQRAVQYWWKEYGWKPPSAWDERTQELLEWLYRRDGRGLTLAQLAEISPWSRSQIAKVLKERGVWKTYRRR